MSDDAPKAPRPCSNCKAPVQPRRPSRTGEHWCSQKACQNAKQRFYHARRAKNGAVDAASLRLQFITALAHTPRTECGKCGLEDALPGWAHRASLGGGPCYGVGQQGMGLGGGWLDAIHPSRDPKRNPVQS